MLRVPTQPICRTHLFWIPKLDEPGIRPTGCANENLAALFRCGCLCNHIATKSHRQRTQCDSGKIAIAETVTKPKDLAGMSRMLFPLCTFLSAGRRRLLGRETLLCAIALSSGYLVFMIHLPV